MKQRGLDSDCFGYEEEVSTSSNATHAAVVGNSPAMTSNVSSLSSDQKKVLYSPDSTSNQREDIEFGMGNKNTEPESTGDFELRYLGNNGEFQMRTGRLPTPGPPPVSESEASSASSSPVAAADNAKEAVSTVHHSKPKPEMKGSSAPRPCLTVRARPRLQVRQRARPRPRGRVSKKADKAAILAHAFRGIKAKQAARGAADAARAVEKEKQLNVNRNVQKKMRKKARKAREEQFIRDLLAFQEEMMRTDAELSRLILEGREKIARVQERRRLREADRQKKRAKLAALFICE